jgi:hypothetical protein
VIAMRRMGSERYPSFASDNRDGFRKDSTHPAGSTKSPGPRSGALHFAETLSPRLFRLADRDLQRADAVDAALDVVAGVELGDAGGRARHDDVAGGEFYLLR